jgi:hypothetical protein
MQCLILITCVVMYFVTGDLVPAAMYFGVMQVAAVAGAAWGASIRARRQKATQRREDMLPLHAR